jgi:hypothetical protein
MTQQYSKEALFGIGAGIICFVTYMWILIRVFGPRVRVRKHKQVAPEITEHDHISGAWPEDIIH